MPNHTVTAEFKSTDSADSAIGRLEVAGVEAGNILVTRSERGCILVAATVEERLYEKAKLVLGAEGLLRS